MPQFFDTFLETFRPPKVIPTETVGAPGTAVFGGHIDDEEKNPKLTGRQKFITYSNILVNTTIAAAGTRYFLNLVAKATWNLEAADDSDQAQEFADKLQAIMDNMDTPWQRVVRRSAMYRFYGFSVQEWTAKVTDEGIIGMKDVAPRPQVTITRWDLSEHGEVEGIIQRSPQTQEELYLPRAKVVYMVDDTLNDSPEGLGLLRHIITASERLTRYEQLEGFGFETDLRGIPVGRAPFAALQEAVEDGTMTKEQKTAAEQPLKDFIRSHIKSPQLGILLDSTTYETADDAERPSGVKQWDMELLQSSSSSQPEINKAIERLNQEIAIVLGVEGLLLGSKDQGSNALSTDKSHNFALIVDSTLDELATTFEKDYRDVIWDLNGWPEEMKPKYKTEAIKHRDIQQITGALSDLANAGAVLAINDPAIDEVRDLAGLSKQPALDKLKAAVDVSLNRKTDVNNEDVNDA